MDLRTRGIRVSATVAILAIAMAACGDDEKTDGGAAGGGKGGKIALLLPENQTARYEAADRPFFEQKVKSLCANCEVLYSNAGQNKDTQLQQAEQALTRGANVLVLDAVDSDAAAAIADKAKAQKVPVIAYDRLVKNTENVDYYISFDNEAVGVLQAQTLVDKLKKDGKTSGSLVMINGSPTDNNATLFKKGAHSIIDGSGFTVAAESDTIEWKPENAQRAMDQAITKSKDFVGVYAANDGTAGGAIAAIKAAGITPIPPVTGQDAEVAALQRIVAGEQFMTVYKAAKKEAELAATIAVQLVRGETVDTTAFSDVKQAGTANGKKDVPSFLFPPVAVTLDNLKDTVLADTWVTADQLCTTEYKEHCTKAGIS